MGQALRDLQLRSGAIFEAGATVPSSYGNDRSALDAIAQGVAICDRSSWGLLQLKGDERSRFLHNQTTNNLSALKAGQGCETVFVTSTGRAIDLATAWITPDSILILVSPNRRQHLMQWMDRYIFPFDKVELSDVSDSNAIFTLLGKASDDLLQKLTGDALIGQPEHTHIDVSVENINIRIAVGSGLAIPGYTLIVPVESAAEIWSKTTQLGAVRLGDRVWEKLRILQGRPASDRELTEDYNPLEAGLWKAISFDKGCYIGQETIARLNTYKGVKQRLWGVKLTAPVAPETPIFLEGEKVGLLTSCIETEDGAFGLAYIRTKAGGEGLAIDLNSVSGQSVSVPFLSHEYYTSEKTN